MVRLMENWIFKRTVMRKVSENARWEREQKQSDPDQIFLSSSEKLGHRAWSSGSRELFCAFVLCHHAIKTRWTSAAKRWPSDSRYISLSQPQPRRTDSPFTWTDFCSCANLFSSRCLMTQCWCTHVSAYMCAAITQSSSNISLPAI